MEYITSEKFIENGLIFPPYRSQDRLESYEFHNKCYSGAYSKGRKLKVKTANGTKELDWKQPEYNYYKLITDKMKTIITSEDPIVKADNDSNTKLLNGLIADTNFLGVLGDVIQSETSLGDGVFYLDNLGGTLSINAVNPANWYKVVSPININNVICHVLVQPIYTEDYSVMYTEERITHLRVLYHYKGYYIEKYFIYDGTRIGQAVAYGKVEEEGRKVSTGFKGFAVHSVHNSKPINGCYGISDYVAITDSVNLMEKKSTQFDLITDKHSDPVFQTSKENGKINEKTGKAEYEVFGNIIFPKKDAVESKYITWDGNLDQLLKYIDKQENNIAVLSEFGKVFLTGDFGSNASGESIRNMAQSVLGKASRLIDTLDYTVKCIFCEMLYTKGIDLNPSDISITWKDGLPNDSMLTQAQAIQLRKQVGTISTHRVLTDYDEMTSEQADVEIERIKAEGGTVNV
jgi:hypothetical protein